MHCRYTNASGGRLARKSVDATGQILNGLTLTKLNLKASTLQKRVTLPLLHLKKKTTPELTSSWQSIYLTADFNIEKL